MLAAATSAASAFFKTSAISQNYIIASPNATSLSSSSSSPSPAPTAQAPSFFAGLWRVQEAHHKLTSKRVSVWSFDKRSSEMERIGQSGKDRVIEVLKAEATAFSRLRHPCVLEMVEPLDETRHEITFATEPVLSTLTLCIPGAPYASRSPVELDEVEIQKGILQLTKGLSFLHTSARLVHTNLNPETVVINVAGDWKISGLGLTIPIVTSEGTPSAWEFPSFDGRMPAYIQRAFDYLAPEYVLSEQIITSSDLYSLGCVIYAVHAKGNPPFRNHNSLSSIRSNVGRLEAGGGLAGMEAWDSDLRDLLSSLITPNPVSRLSSQTLPTHPFFSSIAISTLNFLDRSTFASKTREEKIAFMKGLGTVLSRFSEGMRRRKVLPSLLEEMKDPLLLPSILPNIFNISSTLDATQFQTLVLPSLKPLFAIKEPPQNMITLLENLKALQEKTAKSVFRQDVLPLVYNALESEHAEVQERALKAVPDLCETIDYAEVQGILFPRVALVFTKTRILTVKVSTLVCFLSMVKTLDQSSLTQKLVPLLAKIRTKEPAVMMATLGVHEAMGQKIDREAVATLVLPQLWAMSVGPLLNVDQFRRFMTVIRSLADRVEKEHSQYLRDAQRIEDRSAIAGNGPLAIVASSGVDFESLVGGAGIKTNTTGNGSASPTGAWADDIWGSILAPDPPQTPLPIRSTPHISASSPAQSQSLPGSPRLQPQKLSNANRINPAPSTTTTSGFSAPGIFPAPTRNPMPSPSYNIPISATPSSPPPLRPNYSNPLTTNTFTPMKPQSPPPFSSQSKPNYNISLPTASPFPSFAPTPPKLTPMTPPSNFVLTPSTPAAPQWGGTSKSGKKKADLVDFDPLS